MSEKAKALIGDNSNNNTIVQNSTITNIYTASPEQYINLLGQTKRYDLIQENFSNILKTINSIHPLKDHYVVKVNEFGSLVSTPRTQEAFRLFPKSATATFEFDCSEYPNMNRNETPWEYAYRTQTPVSMKTKSYKEYLGEIEDPFPEHTYTEGMITNLEPPEFPESKCMVLCSGDMNITVKMRRRASFEYKKFVVGCTDFSHGFDCYVTFSENNETIEPISFSIKRKEIDSLDDLIKREKFIKAIGESKKVSIFIDNKEVFAANFTEVPNEFFSSSNSYINYFSNLQVIEEYFKCHFDRDIDDLTWDDFFASALISKSIMDRWSITRMDFDNVIRFNYDNISKDILELENLDSVLSTRRSLQIDLAGVQFISDEYYIVYKSAIINNLSSVMKNVQKKRQDILITIRPVKGQKYFLRYEKATNLRLC